MAQARGLKQPLVNQFQFGPWKLTAVKSHILVSEGSERDKFEASLPIPHVPEMIFADNVLRLEHTDGFGIEFNALDALRKVDSEHDTLKVAEAVEWQRARSDCEHIGRVVKPFDWTFTTDYTGTMLSKGDNAFSIENTTEKIDVEKLKRREKILFYADIMLFEDELHDCGCSILNVKIRVMPTSFFLLLRLYMRVDDVIVRINDTRLYHEAEWDYIIREYTSREKGVKELKVEPHLISDASMVSEHLDLKVQTIEKLKFPAPAKSVTECVGGTVQQADSTADGHLFQASEVVEGSSAKSESHVKDEKPTSSDSTSADT